MAITIFRRCSPIMRLIQNPQVRLSSSVFSVPKISEGEERWNEAMKEASELVQLAKQELTSANVFGKDVDVRRHLSDLISSKHPLAHSLKQLLYNSRLSVQFLGTVSLLVAKAGGHTKNSLNYEEASTEGGISNRQRKLSDVIELYFSSFTIHSSLLNLSHAKDGEISKNLQRVNGYGVLMGDYLVANGTVLLISIDDNKVFGVVSKCLSDYSESLFHCDVDINGNMLPDAVKPVAIWEHVTYLQHASLLSLGCQGMMILAGHNEDLQKVAGEIGKCIAMAFQINKEIATFKDIASYRPGTPFSVALAPVILHLENQRQLLDEIRRKGKDDVMNLDFGQIYSSVREGSGIEEATALLNAYVTKAEENLNCFGPSKSADVLRNIIRSFNK